MLLTDAIRQLFNKNIPFVSYRLTSTDEPVTMVGGSFSPQCQSGHNQFPQFIFSPFDASQSPVQYFIPEKMLQGWNVDLTIVHRESESVVSGISPERPVITDFSSYKVHAEKLIDAMQRHDVEKVVLSRIMEYSFKEEIQMGKIFEKACKQYPLAFVYLLNDGNGQIWLGATPETLLLTTSGSGTTMSLAGTQSIYNQSVENVVWGEKERKEHQFVTDYIHEILLRRAVKNLVEGDPISILAGKMAHLQTNFTFQIPENQDVLSIANALHPTPAVCGLPQQEAFQLITSTENHKRSYYTGFLGIFEQNTANCALFVNLRCMQIIENKAYIYVGGGLTAQSDPVNEWNETELKAGTMLSLFE